MRNVLAMVLGYALAPIGVYVALFIGVQEQIAIAIVAATLTAIVVTSLATWLFKLREGFFWMLFLCFAAAFLAYQTSPLMSFIG